MKEEKLQNLLNELAQTTTAPVRAGLAEDIKEQIPYRIMPHKSGFDTINIIIDLRISKLAAAAAIIITTVLCANLLNVRTSTSNSIYQDSKMLMKYFFGAADSGTNNIPAGRVKYEHLLKQGKKAVYYGNITDPKDSNAVLIQYKLPDGNYQVTFSDLRVKIVTAEQLIELQTHMLQKKTIK
jgi:hypothetical protein